MKLVSEVLKIAQAEILRNGLAIGGFAQGGGKFCGWEESERERCPLCLLGAIGKAARVPTVNLKRTFDDYSGSGALLNTEAQQAIAFLYAAVCELTPEAERGATTPYRQMRVVSEMSDSKKDPKYADMVFARAILMAQRAELQPKD